MFTKRHFDYLIDTILNDNETTRGQKIVIARFLVRIFKRDFTNFKKQKWISAWNGHFHCDSNSQVGLDS